MGLSGEIARVKGEPRMLVIVVHGFIELMVNALIDAKCKKARKINENRQDFSHSVKLVILYEMGLLSETLYCHLDFFRGLRNQASHQVVFEVTKNELSWLKNARYREPENFHELCLTILSSFWNKHLRVFEPAFMHSEFGDDPTRTKGRRTGSNPTS